MSILPDFLRIKNVPIVSWSSNRPLNFKPRIKTLFFLVLGLVFFGFGESLLIHSAIGLSPWVVLAEGLAINFNWSIGFGMFASSVGVLLFWIPLRQQPGVGTILNILVIAGTIELSMYLFDFSTDTYFINLIVGSVGVILVGFGSGIYLTANLGPGPRDGLMTGLQRVTKYPIAWVRVCIEVSVVGVGWVLGGTVGVGTLLFAFGIGPAVAFGLHIVAKVNK
jgi:uncharacterized membrane protein YczE